MQSCAIATSRSTRATRTQGCGASTLCATRSSATRCCTTCRASGCVCAPSSPTRRSSAPRTCSRPTCCCSWTVSARIRYFRLQLLYCFLCLCSRHHADLRGHWPPVPVLRPSHPIVRAGASHRQRHRPECARSGQQVHLRSVSRGCRRRSRRESARLPAHPVVHVLVEGLKRATREATFRKITSHTHNYTKTLLNHIKTNRTAISSVNQHTQPEPDLDKHTQCDDRRPRLASDWFRCQDGAQRG